MHSVKAKSRKPSVGIVQEELPFPCGISSCREASLSPTSQATGFLTHDCQGALVTFKSEPLSIQSREPSPEGKDVSEP